MISNNELLKLLRNKLELDMKSMRDSYMPLIYTVVFNNISISYSKELTEKYTSNYSLKYLITKIELIHKRVLSKYY